jgi:hypothetical protein
VWAQRSLRRPIKGFDGVDGEERCAVVGSSTRKGALRVLSVPPRSPRGTAGASSIPRPRVQLTNSLSQQLTDSRAGRSRTAAACARGSRTETASLRRVSVSWRGATARLRSSATTKAPGNRGGGRGRTRTAQPSCEQKGQWQTTVQGNIVPIEYASGPAIGKGANARDATRAESSGSAGEENAGGLTESA